jgi:2-hydroxychromene-2-carboxylate isomerase
MTGSSPVRVEFFFDCSSPWTYLAFHNIRRMAAELSLEIDWRPVLLGGIFNTVNPTVYEFREKGVPAKQAYVRKDLGDWARKAGLDIRFPPSVFPVNSVKVMRGCVLLRKHGLLEPFAQAAFEAYWLRDRDISQDTVLAGLCADVGFNADSFLEGIAQPEIKAELRKNTDEVIGRGGFGSPTIFVGRSDMYFVRRQLVQHSDLYARLPSR